MTYERGMYHYPRLTDLGRFRAEALRDSVKAPITLHLHPYHDNGCEEGEIMRQMRGSDYEGLPLHERYVNGKKEK